MRRRAVALALLGPLVLAGCGDDEGGGGEPRTVATGSTAADATLGSSGTLVVEQELAPGAPEESTAWVYLRLERELEASAEEVLVRPFEDGRIRFREDFPPGVYRIVAYQRPCRDECPTEDRTEAFAPLAPPCGARVELAADAEVRVVVRFEGDRSCLADLR